MTDKHVKIACSTCGKKIYESASTGGVCRACLTAEKERQEAILNGLHPDVVCPYCRTSGHVYVNRELQKTGFSTAKTTFGVLTGGLSLLATGLAKKGIITTAHCRNCGMNLQ